MQALRRRFLAWVSRMKIMVKTDNKDVEKEAIIMRLEVIKGAKPLVIRDKSGEEKAMKLGEKEKRIFVSCPDWKVIPLENLIAKLKGKTEIIAKVKSAEEALLALEALELGVDGVLLESNNIEELKKVVRLVEGMEEKMLELEEAEVTNILQLGMGARSCLDTVSLMEEGEGMLVGGSSQGMLLIQAEVMENPLAAPRPFRVNAGAVSLYALAPENKTKYIEEIKAGDGLLVVNRKGIARKVYVGRNKIEMRPLVLIEVEKEGKKAKVILQNAETIRLVQKDGSKPVTELKKGDKVLALFSKGGRHFGTLVKEEMVIEK